MRTQLLLLASILMLGITIPAVAQKKRPAKPAATPSPVQKMKTLVPIVQSKIERLNTEVDRVASAGSVDASATGSLSEDLSQLDEDTARLGGSLDSGDDTRDDVRAVLVSATRIDQFLLRNRISSSTSTQWRSLKRDIVSLATYNKISWNWRQSVPALPSTTAGTVRPMPSPTPMPMPMPMPTPVPYSTPVPYESLYNASESQVSTLLSRIDLKGGIFRSQIEAAVRANNNGVDSSTDPALLYVTRFSSAVTRLREQFGRRNAAIIDVTDVLTSATYVDQYVQRNRLSPETEAQWRDLRRELDTLASYYRQSWNWNQNLPTGPLAGGLDLRGFETRITGTFRLNRSLSDDTGPIIDRALRASASANAEDLRLSLERRLRSPEMLAIEMSNRNVTMASSLLPKVTFQADGKARTETNERGRTVSTTATVDEDGLMVTYLGQRSNDFYLTVVPIEQGRIRVTRKVFLDDNNEGITVNSVYDKTSNLALFETITMPGGNNNTGTISMDNSGTISVGTRLDASFSSVVTSSPASDRFTMEVTSPGPLRRSTINGRVLLEDPRSRAAGRTRALLAFDTITLPDGRTYRFNADVLSITTAQGESLEVTNQAASTTAQPRNVGGVLGALIGAIAGVPVNSNAGAAAQGTIVSQQGDSLYLPTGSRVTLTVTQPLQQ